MTSHIFWRDTHTAMEEGRLPRLTMLIVFVIVGPKIGRSPPTSVVGISTSLWGTELPDWLEAEPKKEKHRMVLSLVGC